MRRLASACTLTALALVAGLLGAAAASAEPARPFESPPAYLGRHVVPAHPQARLDATLLKLWRQWRDDYLVRGCTPGTYRVRTSSGTAAYTVSEGHGYGMVLAALMGARRSFNGLYRYFREHPSSIAPGLMAWAQD